MYSYGINVKVSYNELNELRPQQEVLINPIVSFDDLTILPAENILTNLINEDRICVPDDISVSKLIATSTQNYEQEILSDVQNQTNSRDESEKSSRDMEERSDINTDKTKIQILKEIIIKLHNSCQVELKPDKNEFMDVLTSDEIDCNKKNEEQRTSKKVEEIVPNFQNNWEKGLEPDKSIDEQVEETFTISRGDKNTWKSIFSGLEKLLPEQGKRKKNGKIENIRRRKEQRIASKKRQEEKILKQSKFKPKIKCVECNEDLISDTEQDSGKNIELLYQMVPFKMHRIYGSGV